MRLMKIITHQTKMNKTKSLFQAASRLNRSFYVDNLGKGKTIDEKAKK